MPPRSSWVLLWILLTGFIGCYRFLLRDILLSFRQVNEESKVRVVIYVYAESLWV